MGVSSHVDEKYMRLLGAIIAGGGSRRFGGDKAAALIGSQALIDIVAAAVSAQVDKLIICGRRWPGLESIQDRPAPDLGPLGGLNAALGYAQRNGFDAVVTAGCDVLPVIDLRALAGPVAAVIQGQPLFGFWPVDLAERLDRHLATELDRSMRRWIAVSGAAQVISTARFHNLNTRDDLAAYCALLGAAAGPADLTAPQVN